MDYEKKYKDALKRAKKLYEQGTITETLSYIFPELKESKDERIRKDIIKMINNTCKGEWFIDSSKEKCLSWLEKQGEIFTKKDVDDAFVEGIVFAKNELEKQGEQKPTDKVEPKFRVGDWITIKE